MEFDNGASTSASTRACVNQSATLTTVQNKASLPSVHAVHMARGPPNAAAAGIGLSSIMASPPTATPLPMGDRLTGLNVTKYLNSLWDQGMRNTKSQQAKNLILQAVEKTGKQPLQIKNFIHNKRKAEMKSTDRTITKKGTGKRLYDIFMSNELNKYNDTAINNHEKLTRAHLEWNNKKNDPAVKACLKQEQDQMRREEEEKVDKGISYDMGKRLFLSEAKNIENKCKKLSKLGYECIFMAVHKSKHDVAMAGSEDGVIAANEIGLLFTFSSAVIPHGPTSLDSLSDDSLRSKVQTYFNEKYRTCIGIRRTQYDRITSGRVKVMGMPEGIDFKVPSAYGRTTKLRILKEAVNLKFEVVEDEPEELQVRSMEQLSTIEAPPEYVPPIPDGEEERLDEEEATGDQEASHHAASSPASSDLERDVFVHHDESAEAILGPMARGKKRMKNTKEEQNQTKGKKRRNNTKEEQNQTKASGKQRKKKNKEEKNQTEGNKFLVERIVCAKKSAEGQLLFEIKWQGYQPKYNTWEPEKHLPESLVKTFMRKNKIK